MAVAFKPLVIQPLWEKLESLLKARRDADQVEVGEIIRTIHRDPQRFESNGVYILPPGIRPRTPGVRHDADSTLMRFTVVLNSRAMDDDSHMDKLAQLVGLVYDTMEADPLLGGLAEEAYVEDVTPVEVVFGDGQTGFVCTQEATVVVSVARD